MARVAAAVAEAEVAVVAAEEPISFGNTFSFNDLVTISSQRSNHQEEEEVNTDTDTDTWKSITLKHPEEKDDDNDDDDDEQYLVDQRGDSIAKNNHFTTDPKITTPTPPLTKKKKTSFIFGRRRRKIRMTNHNSNTMNMTDAQKKEHDAFCKKLIDEVLGKDAGDKVPMEKVMMIIWQFREDKDVIKFMTRFVSKVSKASRKSNR